ncbi:MAG TPA: hypothetical protein PK286_11275 [Devosia sp.]|nr:hypothetical protein [Devosia sp.]
MNKLIKLGLVAAFVAGSSGMAFAQAAPAAAPAVEAAAAAAGSYEALLATLNAGAKVDLAAVTDATTVNVVKISTLTGVDAAAIDAAKTAQAASLTTLHTDIDANAALKAKLEADGVTTDKVLAVETGADGAVTVYVDDRA